MLVIYIPQITNRIKYTFNFVFRNYLQEEVKLTTNLDETNNDDFIISYGKEVDKSKIHFEAREILFQSTIEKQAINCSSYNNHSIFFQVDDSKSALPYDPFALIFYMLSRYEEYLPFEADEHGRFPAKASLAYREEFLEDPIVEIVIKEIVKSIQSKDNAIQFKRRNFEFEVSFDVDAPFAFRGKGFMKNLGGSFKMMSTGYLKQGLDRFFFTITGGKDPFDQFYDILQILDEYELKAYFFLLMEHEGKNNPAINHKHFAFDILAEKLARYHHVGIHPSYDCITSQKLNEEQKRFRSVLKSEAQFSRHHFIKLRIPETYQILEKEGITQDFSMAFPDCLGFRSGCSRPFPFYDLSKERETNVTIHPFCLMDATFEFYLKYEYEQAILDKYVDITNKIYENDGVLHVVFHNDLVSGYLSKFRWKDVMEQFFSILKGKLGN